MAHGPDTKASGDVAWLQIEPTVLTRTSGPPEATSKKAADRSMNRLTKMLENRTDLILALLYAPGKGGEGEPIDGITRMEKLVFLARNYDHLRQWVEAFDFEPDNFGPFSDELQDEIEKLRTVGLIETEVVGGEKGADEYVAESYSRPTRFSLTPMGRKIAAKLLEDDADASHALEEIKKRFNSVSLDALLSYVYNNSDEEWLKRSIVKDKYYAH